MTPDCYGREYFDEEGGECPHEECLLRYECKGVFSEARGLLMVSVDEEPVAVLKKRPKIDRSIKKKRSGYVKPGRLLYKDEGTLRDKLIFIIRDFLEEHGYSVRATKCLHSFVDSNKKFVLKVDTRRKNSILLYVSDILSEELIEEGFRCRELFDSERPNFPPYLTWVTTVGGERDAERFMTAFSRSRLDA